MYVKRERESRSRQSAALTRTPCELCRSDRCDSKESDRSIDEETIAALGFEAVELYIWVALIRCLAIVSDQTVVEIP